MDVKDVTKSVILNDVTKRYKMYSKNSDKILDIFFGGRGENFYALRGVSFTADEGDVIGIIGINGSGKSTISNIISGVIPPTTGTIEVKGQAALIAIASGLNNELTGRENIELKLLMLGFGKQEIIELESEIIEFAEIGKFIDQPVKSYSSGMKSRLGFAISVNIDPDVLVIDEALSVGDQTFADKCLDKMNEFKEKGKTIFFISHSIGQVKKFCEKALWLEYGEVKDYGSVEEVIPKYERFIKEFKKLSAKEKKAYQQKKMAKLKGSETNSALNDEAVEPEMKRHKRKRTKRKNIMLRLYLLLIVLLVIALVGFFYSSGWFGESNKKIPSQATPDKHVQKEKATTGNPKIEDLNKLTELFPLVVVSKDLVNIRGQASLNGPIVNQGKFGDTFKKLDEKVNSADGITWLQIQMPDGEKAWISSTVTETVDSGGNANSKSADSLQLLFNSRHLPTKFNEIVSLYTMSLDEIKDKFKSGIVDESTKDDTKYIDLKDTQLSFKSTKLSEMTLTNINEPKTSLIKDLGNPVVFDKQNLVYMYIIDRLKVEIHIEPANLNKVEKIIIKPIKI